MELLSLDLRSPLVYTGLENPAIAGAPLRGTTLLPSPPARCGSSAWARTWEKAKRKCSSSTPRISSPSTPTRVQSFAVPFPPPRFYGRRGATAEDAPPARSRRILGRHAPGGRLRVFPMAALRRGGSDRGDRVVRERTWWERTAATGPYILRRLREDGKLATQALSRIG